MRGGIWGRGRYNQGKCNTVGVAYHSSTFIYSQQKRLAKQAKKGEEKATKQQQQPVKVEKVQKPAETAMVKLMCIAEGRTHNQGGPSSAE